MISNKMKTKIEKLREVNENLVNILNRLETYMFIENINDVDIKENDSQVILNIKQ